MTTGEPVRVAVLGLVQALTEFLPVSSSGHLVIVKSLLKVNEVGITLEVVTHVGTAIAVIVYLRRRIAAIIRSAYKRLRVTKASMTEGELRDAHLFLMIVLSSLPAAAAGLAVRDYVARLFEDAAATSAMLIVTGCFVFVSGRFGRPRFPLSLGRAVTIGVAQAIAIVPGLSRSGLTVGTGLALGITRTEAFEFSLLLSLPAVLGASALEVLRGGVGGDPVTIALSGAVALVAGYGAIALLFRAVTRNRFYAFAYYLVPIGVLLFVLISQGLISP